MNGRPPGIEPDWIPLEFIVRPEHAGWRADLFIANQIPRLSRTKVQKILRRAAFDDQGRPVKPNRCLFEGEIITLYRRPPEEPDTPRHFGILFEDEWILAIDKPAGLPVHPTARYFRNTLTGLLQERYGDDKPTLAHRLDSETSGVLLCAKSREAERALKVMFADRKIQKEYLAVVLGIPDPPSGRIEVPLGPDRASPIRVKMAHDPQGLPSLTEYQVVRTDGTRALVSCRPRTGRQHQIRAHLAHLGHPIVGDKMYGPDASVFLDYVEHGPTEEVLARAGYWRQALHAAAIRFTHPMTEQAMHIASPLPEEIATLLKVDTTTG